MLCFCLELYIYIFFTSQAADEAIVTLRSMLGQLGHKRSGSPRLLFVGLWVFAYLISFGVNTKKDLSWLDFCIEWNGKMFLGSNLFVC